MGGSELIAHIRVIQVLPVADNWIDEDHFTTLCPFFMSDGRNERVNLPHDQAL